MYYQRSDLITMPDSCLTLGPNPTTLLQNPTCNTDIQLIWNDLQTQCRTSYDKLCTTAYTDNPPFACIHSHNPPLTTTLSNTFAGTEFAYIIFSTAAIAFFSVFLPKLTKCICGANAKAVIPFNSGKHTNTAVPVVTANMDVESGRPILKEEDEVEEF